jgi:ribosomal protein S18 acetylase RimI-like enzyme
MIGSLVDEAAITPRPCYPRAMQVRTGQTEEEITAAIRIDAGLASTDTRALYIAAVAERGGLRLIEDQGYILGFCCLDDRYFFEKVFISLLIVDPGVRRRGIGQALLEAAALEHEEVWTSTNQSNMAMRGLLTKTGWMFCGGISGLDAGDPEVFFKKTS